MTDMLIRPPNSIIFISDRDWSGDPPTDIDKTIVTFTEECLVTWTRAESDGDTRLLVNCPDIAAGLHFAGSYTISSPSKTVSISDSRGDTILIVKVDGFESNISVYIDDMLDPMLLAFNID